MARQRLLVAFGLVALVSTGVHAQWLNFPTPGTPRTPDGKPDLTAPAPRAPDGKPDLTGVWMHELTSVAEMRRLYGDVIDARVKVDVPGMEIGTQHKYSNDMFIDMAPAEAGSLLRPEAVELMKKRTADRDPSNVCMGVLGFPQADLLSEPIKIIQAPRTTIVLYEAGSTHRQIFADGRALPKEFELPAFNGYSIGHWEGDVFVVETAGLGIIGNAHVLSLRQGPAASPDREILVYLHPKAGESLTGHVWTVSKDMKGAGVPQVAKRWKTNPKFAPTLKSFSAGYAMKLELGQINNGEISGKVFLALPDAEQSVVAGVFQAMTSLATPASPIANPSVPAPAPVADPAFEKRYGTKR